ncbi:MAG: hypothetical protein CMN74_12235 [Sphingorhabdus sp.]|nr:hypothetical protein [Sphingorhabdus sp.]|tara:strand:+ start:406 stop:780 length:375 start_codon:yes stop_codon:yes gene_type:complete
MPIRPENRARYPKDWKAISERIRFDRAGGRCECEGECGLDHEGRCTAEHHKPHPRTGSNVILTTAHLADPIEDCSDGNLKAMCQQCHNRYDAPMRKAGIRERANRDQIALFMDRAAPLSQQERK